MILANTAKMVALSSLGKVEANYFTTPLSDILDPKPVKKRTAKEVIDGIRKKM